VERKLIVFLEEHFAIPEVTGRFDKAVVRARGWQGGNQSPKDQFSKRSLTEYSDASPPEMRRLSQFRFSSWPVPQQRGFAKAWAEPCPRVAQPAAAASGLTGRFDGFAHLPMTAPDADDDELQCDFGDLSLCRAMMNFQTNVLARGESKPGPL
jgi:hypothetical protein